MPSFAPGRCLLWLLLLALTGCTAIQAEPEETGVRPAAVRWDGLLNVPLTFKFDAFVTRDLLTLRGAAELQDNSVRLTEPGPDQWGSVFYNRPLVLQHARSFSTYFRMQMLEPSVPTGDGWVFVLQPLDASIGGVGNALGYQGIAESLGVEFDTFFNPEVGDLDGQHVGTHLHGDMASHLLQVPLATPWLGTSLYSIWIDYNGLDQQLEVRLAQDSDVRPALPVLTQSVDLSTVFVAAALHPGITSSTGSRWARHKLERWYFQNDYAPIDVENNTYVERPTSMTVSASPASNTRLSALTVTLLRADGSPCPHWEVSFATPEATLSALTATTDAQGQAQVTLSHAGGSDLLARVDVTAADLTDFVEVLLLAHPTLTASAAAGGSLTPSGVWVVPYGSDATFQLSPDVGMHVEELLLDGLSVGAPLSYTLFNVTASHTVEARFSVDAFTFSTHSDGHGAISCTSPVDYAGTSLCTVTSSPGFAPASLTDNGVDRLAELMGGQYASTNVKEDHDVRVTFKQVPGTLCSRAEACLSGHCVDGRCCDRACSGQCEACDTPQQWGLCSPVSGAPHGERPACAGDSVACAGRCDGVEVTACSYPSNTLSCQSNTCVAGLQTEAGHCDGQGGCDAPSPLRCGLYRCGETQCHTECAGNAQCEATAYCKDGLCRPLVELPPGRVQGGGGCSASGEGLALSFALLAFTLHTRRRGLANPSA